MRHPKELGWVGFVLHHLLPSAWREELLGDLIEELNGYIIPSRGAVRAKLWLYQQGASAIIAGLWHLLHRGGVMAKRRWLLSLLIGLLGVLQSLDSGVHHSSGWVLGLVALAVFLPVVGLLLDVGQPLWLGVASAVLLTAARAISPIPLPELHISLVFLVGFPMVYYVMYQQNTAGGARGAV